MISLILLLNTMIFPGLKNNDVEILNQRITKTATIFIKGKVAEVFPLFGPIKEKEWAPGWNPEIIYSQTGIVEKHMIFRTARKFDEAEDYTWVITHCDPEACFIEYAVNTSERIWFIAVQCRSESDGMTSASVTYTFTALTDKGARLNEIALEKMYENDLKDWEEAINYYLKHGSLIPTLNE